MQILPDQNGSPGLGALEALRGRTDPASIKKVAKEMEALFAYELIKVMRESVGSDEQKQFGGSTYTALFDQELSRIFAERGLGMQELFDRSMTEAAEKTATGASAAPEPEAAADPDGGADAAGLFSDGTATRVSSSFGQRKDPFTGLPAFHSGMDIAAPEGTEIHAVRKGRVAYSGQQKGYGNIVVIDHGDGFQTKYAHNRTNLVRTGDQVEPGSVIAQVGMSGKATGPHVHFEVQYEGRSIDPNALPSAG